MTVASIIALIAGIVKFPSEALALFRFLQKTTVEERAERMKAIQRTIDQFDQTGRPTWD